MNLDGRNRHRSAGYGDENREKTKGRVVENRGAPFCLAAGAHVYDAFFYRDRSPVLDRGFAATPARL